MERIAKECQHCHRTYSVLPRRAARSKYCTRDCRNQAQRLALMGKGICNNQRTAGCFTKGLTPWNRGRTGIHLSTSTEFKPGHKPVHVVPPLTVTIRKKHDGHSRKWIKLPTGKWQQYARYVWETARGPIPPRMSVHHINRDPLDDRIENLSLMSLADHNREHKAERPIVRFPGAVHPRAKMSEDVAKEVKRLAIEKHPANEIAARLGITYGMAYRIVKQKGWRHLQ